MIFGQLDGALNKFLQFIGKVVFLIPRRQGLDLRRRCAVPAQAIKNIFSVRQKHNAKKGYFPQIRIGFSTKFYILSRKIDTKRGFGYNRGSFCIGSFTLTGELTKKGHFGYDKKLFYINFFGKTTAFR